MRITTPLTNRDGTKHLTIDTDQYLGYHVTDPDGFYPSFASYDLKTAVKKLYRDDTYMATANVYMLAAGVAWVFVAINLINLLA